MFSNQSSNLSWNHRMCLLRQFIKQYTMTYVTVLAKTRIVCTRNEFNFIATVESRTHSISIHPQCIKCWMLTGLPAFVKGILPTLQSHGCNKGIYGGRQLEHWVGLPLTMWPTLVSLAIVWASWLLMGRPKRWFLPPLTPPPIPPTPLLSNTSYPTPCTSPGPPHPAAHSTHPLYKWTAKNTIKFSHQRWRNLGIIKTNRQLSIFLVLNTQAQYKAQVGFL